VAVGNTPPVIKLAENGSTVQGPIAAMSRAVEQTAKVGQPMPLTVWATDDGKYTSGSSAQPRNLPPPIEVLWSKFRGPGAVTFAKAKPEAKIDEGGPINTPFKGSASTTVTFNAPGDYVLHLNVDDFSGRGSGETGCCWTTTLVKVTATP